MAKLVVLDGRVELGTQLAFHVRAGNYDTDSLLEVVLAGGRTPAGLRAGVNPVEGCGPASRPWSWANLTLPTLLR